MSNLERIENIKRLKVKGKKMKKLPITKTIAYALFLTLVWFYMPQAKAWEPPIGIPRPEFGIEETYRMYDDPAKRNSSLTYTQNSEGGYYTHYVDNTHPDATDSINPYGTSETPRVTFPSVSDIGPGAVIFVDNQLADDCMGTCSIADRDDSTDPDTMKSIIWVFSISSAWGTK